jgi:Flp pilus assembly protein CpaB
MFNSSKSSGKSIFDGRKMWFFFAAAAAVISAGVIFSVLSAVSGTASYWMVKDGVNIAARQPITEDMLQEVNVPRESAPKNVLTLGEITANINSASTDDDYYALYALTSGDIITTSNVTTLSGTVKVEKPAGTVLASFKANPSSAAGGMVKEGDLIDIAIVYQSGTEYYASFVLSQVQVVKATTDLDGSTGGGTEGGVTGSPLGAPVLYTVAVTPEQAAALAIATKYSIYVVLTSANLPNVAGTGLSLADALQGIKASTGNLPTPNPTDGTTTDPNATVDPAVEPTPTPEPTN